MLAYTDSVMGGWSFGYDQLNRLVTAANTALPPPSTPNVPAPSWSQYFCWAYDSFGNRLAQSQSNAAFTTGDGACSGDTTNNTWAQYNAQNQIASTNAPNVTPYTPSYDNAGDVTEDENNRYLYDAEGRICAVTTLTGNIGYLYDAAGNRVAKGSITSWSCDVTTNGFTQKAGYVVGPGGEQLTEVDANNNWVHTNVYAGGKQIATYDGTVSAPTLHFYFDDPLGTRRAQANASGVLEAVYVSLPFGDGYAESIAAGADDPTENHFTGKERDTESGNDYFDARYYNSAVGRFLSPDWSASVEPVPYAKLGDPQSLNLYAYVRNNPITGIDPDGHRMESNMIASAWSAEGRDAEGNYMPLVGDEVDAGMAEAWNEGTSAMRAFSIEALQADQRAQQNQVTATWNGKTSVTYTYPDGSTVTRTGTHPWRDNNPGDLTGGHGSIGRDAGGGNVMAIYPSEEAGWNALGLTLTGKYAGTSIIDTMKAFTPAGPKGNDPVAYANMLANAVGVPVSTRISDLSPAQLTTVEVNIARQEGYFASTNSISATNPQ